MLNHFRSIQRIEVSNYLVSFIKRFKSPKRHKLLEKSVSKIDEQLDLVRFLRNMRFQMTAVAGLLTRHQKLYVQRISPIIINESSDLASPFMSDTD